MKNEFYYRLQLNPIIAAIKDNSQLENAIKSPCEIIFILKSDIFNIKSYVDKIRNAGKLSYVHVDLIDGFSRDALALQYIHENIKPDGIITTKTTLVKASKSLNMFVILSFFFIRRISRYNLLHHRIPDHVFLSQKDKGYTVYAV